MKTVPPRTKERRTKGWRPIMRPIQKGRLRAARRDPTETYPVQMIPSKKVPTAPRRDSGARARKIPAPVATPFPPRNRLNTGKR
jgi:hypothetical protein